MRGKLSMNKTRVWNLSDRRQKGTFYYKEVITKTRQTILITTITIMSQSYYQIMGNHLRINKQKLSIKKRILIDRVLVVTNQA